MFNNQSRALSALLMMSLLSVVTALHAAPSYRTADGELLHDPTQPLSWQAPAVAKNEPDAGFQLSYILSAQHRKYAHINGQKVGEGESVAGAKVLSISANQVVLSRQGKRYTLQVNPVSVIRQHN